MMLITQTSYWVDSIAYTLLLLGSLAVAFLIIRLLVRLNYPSKRVNKKSQDSEVEQSNIGLS